jgi:hypothetical protein
MLKLNKDTKFRYDEDEQAYIFEFDKGKKPKKVASRFLSILLGKNSFNTIGYGILERNRVLEPEGDIDTWYKIRGAIAEYFAEKELHKQFKTIPNFTTKRFATNQFKWYDQFHEDYKWGNDKWGGTVDIAIPQPDTVRAVVEVKGKTLEKRDFLDKTWKGVEKQPSYMYQDDEILQGLQLGHLSKVDNLFMCYVLFPKAIEERLKTIATEFTHVENYTDEDVLRALEMTKITQDDLTYVFKHVKIDHDKVQELMQTAYDNLQRHSKSGAIPKLFFSEEERNDLNMILGRETNLEDNLPF